MNTTETTTTKKTVKAIVSKVAKKLATKPETFRSYLYTGKTNKNWIAKNAKVFGSESKFLDAIVTAARKNKLEVKAPTIKTAKKVAAKKTVKRSKNLQ